MDHWFKVIAAGCELTANTVEELDDVGFVVIAGPVEPPQLARLAGAYDAVIRADVAGRADGIVSYGSSGVVDSHGNVRQSAKELTEDLIVADLEVSTRDF